MPESLLHTVTPRLLKRLIKSTWEGGHGVPVHLVGDMTLDQFFFTLCDEKNMRSHSGRSTNVDGLEAAVKLSSEDGLIRGRDRDGNVIHGRYSGESVAQRLSREAREKKGTG